MIWERAVAENAWQLDDGLYRILLPLPWAVPFVNVYVLHGRSEFALVDCGMNWLPSLRALGRALKAIGVPPRGLDALLLTHRHPDHAGALEAVQERWGGRILIDAREKSGRDAPTSEFREWMLANGTDEATVERATSPGHDRSFAVPSFAEDLRSDRPFVVGDLQVEVIPAPGHSPGQVMLREPSRGWLITADHVLPVQAPNVWLFPGDETDPFGTYLEELDRASALAASLILPSHGLPWRGTVHDAAVAMREFHLDFASTVRRLVSNTPVTAWQIARKIRPLAPEDPVGIRFSLAETLAALRYLERRGAVRRIGHGCWEATDDAVGDAQGIIGMAASSGSS